MAFLDDLGRTLSDKGREAAQMAREMAELVQLKTQLGAERSRLRDLYCRIGKAYFEKYQESGRSEFPEEFDAIGQSFQKIAELEEKIHQLDGSKTCACCGAPLDRDAAFCSKCGAQTEEAKKTMLVLGEQAFQEEIFEEEADELAEDAEIR